MKRYSLIVMAASLLLAACGPSVDKQELRARVAHLDGEAFALRMQVPLRPEIRIDVAQSVIRQASGLNSGPTDAEKAQYDIDLANWQKERDAAASRLAVKEKELADAKAALGTE